MAIWSLDCKGSWSFFPRHCKVCHRDCGGPLGIPSFSCALSSAYAAVHRLSWGKSREGTVPQFSAAALSKAATMVYAIRHLADCTYGVIRRMRVDCRGQRRNLRKAGWAQLRLLLGGWQRWMARLGEPSDTFPTLPNSPHVTCVGGISPLFSSCTS